MLCPTCQVVVRSGSGPCPTCGTEMRAVNARDAIEVVDASEPLAANPPQAPLVPQHEAYSMVPSASASPGAVQRSDPRATALSLLARLPELSMQAWQQPLVRSAVRTGLGAVALSLAVRGAQRLLVPQAARRGLAASISPSLARVDEMLRATEGQSRGRGRRGIKVSETIIIIRRTARR